MATIHDEIDNYLAADLHGELLEDERSALHTHLVECAACRKAHQETKAMNKILEETLAQEKPDPAFEQRMLSSFRSRIPQRRSGFPGSPRDESVRLADWIVDLMRLRAVQFTAVAAIQAKIRLRCALVNATPGNSRSHNHHNSRRHRQVNPVL